MLLSSRAAASQFPSSLTALGNLKSAPQETLKGDWLSAIPNPSNLDVALSTVATKAQLPSSLTALGNLKTAPQEILSGAWLSSIPNPPNIDVALSTRLKIGDYSLTQELGKVGLILTTGGGIIDPRSIRALTSSDVVSAAKSGTWNIDNLLNPHPVSLASIPNPPNLDAALSTRAAAAQLPAALDASGYLKTHEQGNITIGTDSSGMKTDLDSLKGALNSVGTDSLLIKSV